MSEIRNAWKLFCFALRGGQADALAEVTRLTEIIEKPKLNLAALGVHESDYDAYLGFGVKAAMVGMTPADMDEILRRYSAGTLDRPLIEGDVTTEARDVGVVDTGLGFISPSMVDRWVIRDE